MVLEELRVSNVSFDNNRFLYSWYLCSKDVDAPFYDFHYDSERFIFKARNLALGYVRNFYKTPKNIININKIIYETVKQLSNKEEYNIYKDRYVELFKSVIALNNDMNEYQKEFFFKLFIIYNILEIEIYESIDPTLLEERLMDEDLTKQMFVIKNFDLILKSAKNTRFSIDSLLQLSMSGNVYEESFFEGKKSSDLDSFFAGFDDFFYNPKVLRSSKYWLRAHVIPILREIFEDKLVDINNLVRAIFLSFIIKYPVVYFIESLVTFKDVVIPVSESIVENIDKTRIEPIKAFLGGIIWIPSLIKASKDGPESVDSFVAGTIGALNDKIISYIIYSERKNVDEWNKYIELIYKEI